MGRIGSMEPEDEARMMLVSRHIYTFKHLAWCGMVPLSEQRWKEKGLDKNENFDIAAQYLSGVVAAFYYLNLEIVRGNLRETFHLISELWANIDDDAVYAVSETEGPASHGDSDVACRMECEGAENAESLPSPPLPEPGDDEGCPLQ
ncbi:hypothetical protein BDV06DRAFT_218378 [Aspergillus oleicola]